MSPLLIPQPDPSPLPGPAWLFHALLLLTFFVHVLFMNVSLGAAVIGAVHGLAGKPERRQLARRALAAILPAGVSFTVTTGVAPLLFVQVLYGQLFYPATILVGWAWLAVPVVIQQVPVQLPKVRYEATTTKHDNVSLSVRNGPGGTCEVYWLLTKVSQKELLDRMQQDPSLRDLPVVVFTGRELSPSDESRLHGFARSIVVKGVESPERLLDETALFLHRVIANLPPAKQKMLESLHQTDTALAGKHLLIVDDDETSRNARYGASAMLSA